jgi:signal transduction histidine kinase
MEIAKAADQATILTSQLLAFSRQQVLSPRVVDINKAVRELSNMLQRLVGPNVEIKSVLEAGLWNVAADPGELERVLVNLALNARDAMSGNGTLIIETSNRTIEPEGAVGQKDVEPGPHVMLSVTDTGSGMSQDVRQRLFEPFFSTKEKGKGTGLGLSSVYGVVKQSGGFIRVASEAGHGTTFSIYLPRAASVVDDLLNPIPRVAAPQDTLRLLENTEQPDSVRPLRRLGSR